MNQGDKAILGMWDHMRSDKQYGKSIVEEGMEIHSEIQKVFDMGVADGTAMLVLDVKDNSIKAISRAEFAMKVLDIPMTEDQKNFITSMMDMDFSSIEARVAALHRGRSKSVMSVAIHGISPSQIWVDECCQNLAQSEEEQEIQVGSHLVKPNKRTKGKAHALPFFLGSKRRY